MLRNGHGNAKNRRFRLVTRIPETLVDAQSAPRRRLLTSHSASILRSTRRRPLQTLARSSLSCLPSTTYTHSEGSSLDISRTWRLLLRVCSP
jgi:hypothetical protein